MSLPMALAFDHWRIQDWDIFRTAGERITAGLNPYDAAVGGDMGTFRYSPLLAYFFAAISPIGKVGWSLVAFGMLLLLRDWRLILIFLIAWPFWRDVETGLSFVEIPLVALIALRGSYFGSVALVAFAVLMPRPMMLPLIGWLLWKDPRLRLPSLVLAAVLIGATILTGWADEWARAVFTVATTSEQGQVRVTDLLGPLWLLMLPLAGWLFLRGRLGFAALAISPYWTPAYPMLLVLEIPGIWRREKGGIYPCA